MSLLEVLQQAPPRIEPEQAVPAVGSENLCSPLQSAHEQVGRKATLRLLHAIDSTKPL
jgi:hypothetical protein